ncbi:MAG TPA: C25 family cysteine peptidase, partial [Blastocatellia bacterium]|nr:C25 family cysteine peptidase [Blastocatellia bacterium]
VGSAYVFTRSGTTWSQQTHLIPFDGDVGGGLDQFGISVAISVDTVIVGSNLADIGANINQGAAYIYVRSGTTWFLQQKITASDGAQQDRFGNSVAIDGDSAIIGASMDDIGANTDQGSAYVFTRSGSNWSQQQKFSASDGAANKTFGASVAISGDTAVVGADEGGLFLSGTQGSAYVFTRSGTVWSQQQKLLASDGSAVDTFGFSVAISQHHLVVGAPGDTIGANQDQGSAYVFVESSPAPIVVTNTNDSGAGSLRQAITTANSTSGFDLITFNIPGSGVKTIALASPLPAINDQVTIDGTTQPGYAGSPLIEINGQNAGAGSGLTITAGDSTIKALVINRFNFNGIVLSTRGNNVVQSCYIGTDATGTIDRGNIVTGIVVSTPNNTIGGASASLRNIISGNDQNGVVLLAGATNNTIQLNRIGTSATGGVAIGNVHGGVVVDTSASGNAIISNLIAANETGVNLLGSGNTVLRNDFSVASNGADPLPNSTNILISGFNNSIGSANIFDKNTLRFASGAGIAVTGGTGNAIFPNSITSNGGLGIDLGNDGMTTNDTGDPDTGPNNLQNYPVVTSANLSGISLAIQATLNSTPQSLFTIDFYWSTAADPSGFGEGQNYIGSRLVLTEDSGNTDFTTTFSPVSSPAGSFVTAVARDASGSTSEFSRAMVVSDASACGTLELNPTSASPGDAGGSGLVNVIKAAGCSWIAVSNNAWINITGGSPGNGNGTVTYNVASNPNPGVPRTGTMTIGGQTFTVFQSHGPTAIQDLSAYATSFENGALIEWRTGLEISNLGFNLYRDASGKRELVNPRLIAGSALVAGSETVMTAGRAYSWFDSSPPDNSAAYWVEAVDTNGRSTWCGPFYVTQSSGQLPEYKIRQAVALTEMGRRAADGQNATCQLERSAPMARATLQSLGLESSIATKEAIKISVRSEGWYRVTQPELVGAGLNEKINPQSLRLFADGIEQPILVTWESDGSFDSGDSIEFYGIGLDTPSTDTRVYWLVAGEGEGKRIKLAQTYGKPGGAQGFPYTIQRKERTIYFSSLLNGEAENFFGSVIASQPVDQSLTLHSIDAGSGAQAVLEVALQGVTDLPQYPDHQVRVVLNGTMVGRLSFDGRQRKVEQFFVSQTSLVEGTNTVTLAAEGGSSDISLVDHVRLTYSHTFAAEQNALRLAVPEGARTQTITGFSSPDIRVFDVTEPVDITEITGVIDKLESGYSVTVDMAGEGPRTLLAMTSARILQPNSIAQNFPSRLRQPANGADLLVITSRELMSSVEPLASHRRSEGLSVTIIDVEDIFDEFSFGSKAPQAIKDFLAYTITSWKKKPRYVLFAGDASYDPRNYLGFGETDLVPTRLIDTQLMETASDDWFGDFNDDGLAEISIGRLAARTAEEATLMVNKLIRYDESKPSEEALLVADRNDGFNFEAATLAIEPLLTGLRANEVFRSRMDDATAKNALIEAINRGQKIVNYAGHGSADAWRGGLLTSNDARELANSRLTLFVMMNCLNGYFQDAAADSLGESLMKDGRGGAVAVWASSGMTTPDGQALLDQEFYRQLSVAGTTFGEAIKNAKAATDDLDIRRTWILLGDPAMRVK